MRNHKKRSFHEHLLAIGLAIVLVAGVSVGINQSGLLSADILQNGGVNSVLSADVSYKTENNILRVNAEKVFANAKSLTFMIVYNPDSIEIDSKSIQTSYDYTSSSGKDGVMHVSLFFTGAMPGAEQLLEVPFTGSPEDVTISDANMLFNEGNIDGLAIKKQ